MRDSWYNTLSETRFFQKPGFSRNCQEDAMYLVGIDIGALTVKAVVLDGAGNGRARQKEVHE
jgi:activator of 2-hydroxyglutaryl-CoA dehydratase